MSVIDIQVVLIKDDPKLGKRGEVVKVSSGFAQNFLYPQAKALPATPANLKSFQAEHARHVKEEEAAKEAAQALTKKIALLSVTIAVLSGEEDKLFGSVTNQDIQAELEKQGVRLDRKAIHLADPLRKLGNYEVVIKPHADFSAKLKVQVIKKK